MRAGASENAREGPTSERADALSSPKPRVLVADDDESIRDLARGLLEGAGLSVSTVARGDEALARVSAAPRRYAALVLDVMMPGLDGYTVLSSMQRDAEMASIPVVLLTAHAGSDRDIVRGIEAGAHDHVTKPFRGAVLVARVKALCEWRLRELSLRQRLEQAERAATTDALTGLGNRREFECHLLREIAYVHRHREPLSLLLLDIDHFKSVNDTFGHPEGDRVLVFLASEIEQALRRSDRGFRLGGEEFALLLRGADRLEGLAVAERLRRRIKRASFEFDGGRHRSITFSGGVASADASNDFLVEGLVERADQALYRAKHGGRDRSEGELGANAAAPRWSDLAPRPDRTPFPSVSLRPDAAEPPAAELGESRGVCSSGADPSDGSE